MESRGNPYTFSRPVPRDPADEYTEDKLFSIDRRHNALDINLGANNYVVNVSDDIQWDQALVGAAVSVLSQMPGNLPLQGRAALIRSAMRGDGRGRFR